MPLARCCVADAEMPKLRISIKAAMLPLVCRYESFFYIPPMGHDCERMIHARLYRPPPVSMIPSPLRQKFDIRELRRRQMPQAVSPCERVRRATIFSVTAKAAPCALCQPTAPPLFVLFSLVHVTRGTNMFLPAPASRRNAPRSLMARARCTLFCYF